MYLGSTLTPARFPSADMDGEELMIHTTANHQEAVQMLWGVWAGDTMLATVNLFPTLIG